MRHYELARPWPHENAHLATGFNPEHWVRWGHRGIEKRVWLTRHEAALTLANWRKAAQEEPDKFRLYRRY